MSIFFNPGPAIEYANAWFLNKVGMRSGFFQSSLGPLHYLDAQGQGLFPPIVLLHGVTGSANNFSRMTYQLLRLCRRVIIPDLPGHGQSPALNPPGDYQAVILALSELISGIVDEPCVIFGNSVGGAAAICTTVTHPESVCGLFLESPAGGAITTAERENLRLCFNGLTMADATQAVKKLFSEPPWWIRINMHVVMRALQAPIVDHILKTIPLEGFSDQALEKISVPTLVVWGTKEMVLPRASLEFYRKNMPKHVKFLEPVGAGHAPYLENPLRSLKWLREFLQENFQPALKLVGTGK